jgi:hypothetical protein
MWARSKCQKLHKDINVMKGERWRAHNALNASPNQVEIHYKQNCMPSARYISYANNRTSCPQKSSTNTTIPNDDTRNIVNDTRFNENVKKTVADSGFFYLTCTSITSFEYTLLLERTLQHKPNFEQI